MLSTYKDTFGYKFCDCTDKQNKKEFFISLLKDFEIQSFLKEFIDAAIATSELQILKRLSHLEEMLGVDDSSDVATIPERLDKLEEKVNTPTFTLEPILELPINPVTKTQKRACALVSKLRKCKKRFLTSSEIIAFLKHEVPEDIQISENTCNPREIKREVLEKATELFPDIQLNKAPHGRREVRILVS